jgi:hypothetical protein
VRGALKTEILSEMISRNSNINDPHNTESEMNRDIWIIVVILILMHNMNNDNASGSSMISVIEGFSLPTALSGVTQTQHMSVLAHHGARYRHRGLAAELVTLVIVIEL